MPDVEIRPTESADVDQILRIEGERYGPDAWSRRQVEEELAAVPTTRWYASAVQDGAVLGYVGFFLSPPDADVQTLTVADSAARRGIATTLLTGALSAVQAAGCHRIFLEVRADNEAALNLYRSFGFERLGVRRNYYRAGGDAVNMRLKLSRTALEEAIDE